MKNFLRSMMLMASQEIKPFIFAACDVVFYERYGRALKNSARAHGFKVEVHCSGQVVDSEESRAYHSALRYLLLPDMLKQHEGVLCLDTDSIINEPFTFHRMHDLGIFFRYDRTEPNMRVLASMLYVKNTAMDFAEELKRRIEERIEKKDLIWCGDQEQIWLTYKDAPRKYRTKAFGQDFLDWKCGPTAPIWTGKGGNKTNNIEFIKRVTKYA